MMFGVYAMAVACVVGIAAGQIMFKCSALAMNEAATLFALRPLLFFGATMVLYGVTSIGWVIILRHAELGKIYPVMALAFVFVPAASYFLFGERFSGGYIAGSALIAAGLIIIFSTTKTA